jgi:hypothetical protein
MDTTVSNQVLAYVAIVISVGSILMGIINHRRIRSRCCGHKADLSFDVDSTAPAVNESPKHIPTPV